VSGRSTGKRLQGQLDTRRRVRLFCILGFDPCYEVVLRWAWMLSLLRRRACVALEFDSDVSHTFLQGQLSANIFARLPEAFVAQN
jgi:hypothetical protein